MNVDQRVRRLLEGAADSSGESGEKVRRILFVPLAALGVLVAACNDTAGTTAAEGVATDSQGNIYGAEVGPRALKKYVKR